MAFPAFPSYINLISQQDPKKIFQVSSTFKSPYTHTTLQLLNPELLHAHPADPAQELSYVEFFAGQGEVFRAVRADAHPSCAVDIRWMDGPKNPMDILSDAGFAFKPEIFFVKRIEF